MIDFEEEWKKGEKDFDQTVKEMRRKFEEDSKRFDAENKAWDKAHRASSKNFLIAGTITTLAGAAVIGGIVGAVIWAIKTRR